LWPVAVQVELVVLVLLVVEVLVVFCQAQQY
jgi:hypothetical protein